MKSAAVQAFLLGCSLLVFTGCVRESTNGQRHEFAFQWWVSAAALLIGAALIVGGSRALASGWRHLTAKARTSWLGFVLVGLILALGLGPSVMRYRIVVDPNGFSIRSGILGTSLQEVKFNNLSRMELVAVRTSQSRGGSRTNYHLQCEGKSGAIQRIQLHDAVWSSVAHAAIPLIEENARKRGVVVVNSR